VHEGDDVALALLIARSEASADLELEAVLGWVVDHGVAHIIRLPTACCGAERKMAAVGLAGAALVPNSNPWTYASEGGGRIGRPTIELS